MTSMTRLSCAIALICGLALPAIGQSANPQLRTIRLNSTNSQTPPILDFTGLTASGIEGANSHRFGWMTVGTVTAGACRMESSPTFSPFTATEVIAAQTVTSSGGPTSAAASTFAYGRIYCTTAISGSGFVVFFWIADYWR